MHNYPVTDEDFMSFDHAIALATASIGFLGLLAVIIQLRDSNRQRESDSLVKIYDINRQLLTLGFSHPKLFGVLKGVEHPDPVFEKHYLQLWFNQYAQMHSYLKRSLFKGDFKESLERDLSDFLTMQNVQHYWKENAPFYPASFQAYVNDILKTDGPPPPAAAHVKHKPHHATKT